MRKILLLGLPTMLLAACASPRHPVAAPASQTGSPLPAPVESSAAPSAGPTASLAAASPPPSTGSSYCQSRALSLRLGDAGGAAGSRYEPIIFTNSGTRSCTIFGYPGVSFVAPGGGRQIGAPATRNPAHPSAVITIGPGASASALLQIVNDLNYPSADCRPVSVSGLRVYPPGNTEAAYVPFSAPTTACSTQVNQLGIEATLSGSTGQ